MESRNNLQVAEIAESDVINTSGFLFTITYEEGRTSVGLLEKEK